MKTMDWDDVRFALVMFGCISAFVLSLGLPVLLLFKLGQWLGLPT